MEAPSIGRSGDDIQNVGDFMTLIQDAENRGTFFCQGCGKLLSGIAKSIKNDGKTHYFPCPSCKQVLGLDAGWLVAQILQARERAKAGLGPVVDPGKRHGGSLYREELLPDGRKRIIVTPAPAVLNLSADLGGKGKA